jgi:hypothetical protein
VKAPPPPPRLPLLLLLLQAAAAAALCCCCALPPLLLLLLLLQPQRLLLPTAAGLRVSRTREPRARARRYPTGPKRPAPYDTQMTGPASRGRCWHYVPVSTARGQRCRRP